MQTSTIVACLRRCDKHPVQNFVLKAAADRLEELDQRVPPELPCKVGDMVWAIRKYKGVRHPQQGVVNSMYYLPDMTLHITVKHIARGTWGKAVFATEQECLQAIAEQDAMEGKLCG